MLIDRINELQSPVARMLLSDLHTAMCDAMFVPNTLLPKELHGTESVNEGYEMFGRSVSDLMNVVDAEDRERAEQQAFLEEKEIRLREYEQAIADDRRIEFRDYFLVINKRSRMLLDAIAGA